MRRLIVVVALAVAATIPAATAHAGPSPFSTWRSDHWAAITGHVRLVRTWRIDYRAHNGEIRPAFVVLPRWYGPRDHPPIPLVISPHGRGIQAAANARLWGNLPALGQFAVVNPEGQGRIEELYSWGNPGQISDLARMPALVRHALPWLRIARHRIYAVGGSMGGQETLLLVAEHPRLLAGAISFDAPTNMAARYRAFAQLRDGARLQWLARRELGGLPWTHVDAWADRSPLYAARAIAASGVPLELWWSTRDRIVVDQTHESERLYDAIVRLNAYAPVAAYVGTWRHTAEMHPLTQLPLALARMGLLDLREDVV